jgi:hypothetical protein
MAQLTTSLVGVTFNGRQERIRLLSPGQKLFWRHESENPHDANAMRVFADAEMTQDVGHLRANLAKILIERKASRNCEFHLFVEKVVGGTEEKQNLGVRVLVMTEWKRS